MTDVTVLALYVQLQNSSHPFLYYQGAISISILIIYVFELIIKAFDNKSAMWKNKWEIFNLTITFSTALLELIIMFVSERGIARSKKLENLRILRVFRIFKLVANIAHLRIIIKTITVAFRPLLYIGVLMLMALGLFSIVGVSLFSSDAIIGIKGRRFNSLGTSIALLYQIMTLDNWTDSYFDLIEVLDPLIVSAYFVLWICLGAFIFKNVFVGVLVNNFAKVDEMLREERERLKKFYKLGLMKKKFQGELKRAEVRLEKAGSYVFQLSKQRLKQTDDYLSPIGAQVKKNYSWANFATRQDLVDWETILRETISAITLNTNQVKWPRKLSYEYLQILSSMQEDIEELTQVDILANQLILEILQ
eukprot:NODE_101_length_19951_cov_0.932501.p7 type:complete len:363 gc:universal NODE_101_length_19951_cov_0.932501:5202-6290(+)